MWEIWILENPLDESEKPKDYRWKRFASGLHEPIGLTWHDGALYLMEQPVFGHDKEHKRIRVWPRKTVIYKLTLR